MTSWNSINAGQLLPSTLVSAVSTLTEFLAEGLGAIEDKLDVASNIPSIPSVPNATVAVVNALLDTLSELLAGGRIHTLVVPIAKKPPKPVPPPIPPTIQDLQNALGVDLGSTTNADEAAYARMLERAGGNAGFYAAFAESLLDLSDQNRPQYDEQHDAVAMATLIVGAPTLASIASAATTLETLLKPKGSAGSMTARVVPTPQSLKARCVATPSGEGVGVCLDWDPPKNAYEARYFPGVTLTVKRYAVIRSTDPAMQSARSVWDLFNTATLAEGQTSGKHVVVRIGSGRNAAFLDEDADTTQPSYYAVAWECEVREEGIAATLAFDKLSSVVKIAARVPTPPQTGVSPDWVATPSAIDMLPGVSVAATKLIEQARVLLAPPANPVDRLRDATSLVSSVSARLSARASALGDDVKRLSAALARPMPGIYVTRMSSGSGGNAFLLAELAKRLGDTSDPSRPPFDHGEYVCGVCFVAGAARLADLASVLALFDSLFGPADASNPLLGVLTAIDTLVTQAETEVFTPEMQPASPEVAATIDPLTGRPPVMPRPAIAATGTAVASNDPANPEAGETNVTQLSELC